MEGKKISFGFSKVKVKPSVIPQRQVAKPADKVEYITSFDKNEKKEEKVEPEIIIPVKENYTVAARILSKRRKQQEESEASISSTENMNGNDDHSINTEDTKKSDISIDKNLSIEKLAIQELLDNSKQLHENTAAIPILSKDDSDGLELAPDTVDYESVTVDQFGEAMLRGMGWTPGKGIGKKQKIVEVKIPQLRPRGLGLGADSVIKEKKDSATEPKS